MSAPDWLLEVDSLCVDYGHAPALRGVSLRIAAGEAVALVGANGAGKTTLFRAIVGLVRPHAGTIRLAGRSIMGWGTAARIRAGLGYAPEGRRIFPGLTVRENLEVSAFCSERDRLSRIADAFALFPALASRQHTPGWQLSGGQQQMLAVTRALMGRPALVLLDEPSLGLSPKLAEEVFRQLHQITGRGTTVLLAEQNVSRALRYCDRAYVLELGNMVLSGTADDLRRNDAVQRAYLGG